MKIINISPDDLSGLKSFVDSLGDSAKTFRYFASRPLAVVSNHVSTKLLLDQDGRPVGYGHLDPEQDKTWLGIALLPEYKGKGLGKLIMQDLIADARKLGIRELNLSVDNANQSAIALYLKSGFVLVEKREAISFFKLPL